MIDYRYHIERNYPIAFATAIGALFFQFQFVFGNVRGLLDKLVDSSLIVSGTLMGFLLTITTVINSVDTRRMRFVKQQKGYGLLMKYLRLSINLNIITVSITILIPFVVALNLGTKVNLIIDAVLVFMISWAWIASIRFATLFVSLLADEEPPPAK